MTPDGLSGVRFFHGRGRRRLPKIDGLQNLGQLRHMYLIEPGKDEQYVLGHFPTGDNVTLQSGIHRFQECRLKLITVCESVVLVTEVVEVLDWCILGFIEADGVVDTIGIDDSAIQEDVSLLILVNLLHPDILGAYVIVTEVQILVVQFPVQFMQRSVCLLFHFLIIPQSLEDDVTAFHTFFCHSG